MSAIPPAQGDIIEKGLAMFESSRRIIVDLTDDGRSTVDADARDVAVLDPVAGFRVHEVWCQQAVPGRVDDHGARSDDAEITPPPGGALVRVLTIAPVALAEWVPNLHDDNDRHVLLLVSGTVELVLEDTEVTMTVGDSVVLSGHVHDWRNTSGEPAVLVYTTFTLTAGDSAI